jgi:uncharacterized protein YihD (DUF1040 family)
MRDINRIDPIIDKLREVWKQYPDLRLTQLMWILGKSNYTFFYVEDDHIEKKLDRAILHKKLDE